jgi:hypothetical protein
MLDQTTHNFDREAVDAAGDWLTVAYLEVEVSNLLRHLILGM